MATPTAHKDAQGQNNIDRNVRQYTDLDLFFGKKATSKDISKVTDIQAVKRSIRNLVLTNFYEKPFHPEIGTGVRAALFQNFTAPVKALLNSRIQEQLRKYAFQVSQFANKIEIKNAVRKKFDVEVEKVATMNRKGKVRQMTVRSGGRVIRTSGKRPSWKRAVVTLKEGFAIDLMGGEVSS